MPLTPGLQQLFLDNWFSPILERDSGGHRQPDGPLSQMGLDPGGKGSFIEWP